MQDDYEETLNDVRDIMSEPAIARPRMTLGEFAALCHADNAKWWHDPATGQPIERNKGELIALMHSELSEMLEAVRKNLMDDKLPQHKGEHVELADLFIRAFDYAGAFGIDLDRMFWEKRAFNAIRKDHSHAERMKDGGKKF